jgi:hypothetical protein
MFPSKEMCHEELHYRSRIDLADCGSDAHPDCKRSPRVPVELRIREQRLLRTSRASGCFCLRLNSQGGLAFASALPRRTINLETD